jgi:hypothetical protein
MGGACRMHEKDENLIQTCCQRTLGEEVTYVNETVLK